MFCRMSGAVILLRLACQTPTGVSPPETLNAFGFESLTLVEKFLDLQDAFGVRFFDAELRGVHGLTTHARCSCKRSPR